MQNDVATGYNKRAFQIGLTLTGGVSAGAYSAGVFDFLIEALSEWERAKTAKLAGEPNASGPGGGVPDHGAFISVISGASAGGITGALGLVSLSGGIRPRYEGENVVCVLPELYEAWVTKPKLFTHIGDVNGAEGGEGLPSSKTSFLDVSDLEQERQPASILNSKLLKCIADEAIEAAATARGTGNCSLDYPFVTDRIELFLTLTNLEGIAYDISIEGDDDQVEKCHLHADWIHYSIRGIGGRPYPAECKWAANGTGIPLSFAKGPEDESIQSFKEAVLATSAFPFGLAPRQIPVSFEQVKAKLWPFEQTTVTIKPNYTLNAFGFYQNENGGAPQKLNYVYVDGGTLNNNPFDLARAAIIEHGNRLNPHHTHEADRAVIIINPFPTDLDLMDDRILANRENDLVLTYVLKRIFPALLTSARINMADILRAADKNIKSRFFISPNRDGHHPALASDGFYAFGGFLSEKFRYHDYQLGRLNCQRFLKKEFYLSHENPLFAKTPGDLMTLPQPIVPLYGNAAREIPRPVWPSLSHEELRRLDIELAIRCDRLVSRVVRSVRNLPMRWAIEAFWWVRKQSAFDALRDTIRQKLLWNEQLPLQEILGERASEFGNSVLVSAVMAELYDPNYDFRTAEGVLKKSSRSAGNGIANASNLFNLARRIKNVRPGPSPIQFKDILPTLKFGHGEASKEKIKQIRDAIVAEVRSILEKLEREKIVEARRVPTNIAKFEGQKMYTLKTHSPSIGAGMMDLAGFRRFRIS